MRTSQALRALTFLNCLSGPLAILGAVAAAALGLPAQTATHQESRITPVQGESWLSHTHRTFDTSSMGRTWSLGPPPAAPGGGPSNWQLKLSPTYSSQSVPLHGSDVYRLNCRGCHQESGTGAPPEINSVVDPVRATSVDAIIARMNKIGMPMSRADAKVLAEQGNAAVLLRLHQGGKSMPPFPQLPESEIRVLIPYLKQLAGVPGAEKAQGITVQAAPLSIGEQIVKANCHICHDATGPNPTPQQILNGAIPPLSTLTTRTSLPDFVRKVTVGSPITMGAPPLPYRGKMSVFYYLSQDEAASAYSYLSLYPPQR